MIDIFGPRHIKMNLWNSLRVLVGVNHQMTLPDLHACMKMTMHFSRHVSFCKALFVYLDKLLRLQTSARRKDLNQGIC